MGKGNIPLQNSTPCIHKRPSGIEGYILGVQKQKTAKPKPISSSSAAEEDGDCDHPEEKWWELLSDVVSSDLLEEGGQDAS